MTAPEHSKPVRLASLALHHALAEDWPKVGRAMQRLSDECGGEGIDLALCAWVDTYVEHARDGDMMTPSRGRMVSINAATGSTSQDDMPPEISWAMRLVQARASLDHDAYSACIDKLPSDDRAEIGRY